MVEHAPGRLTWLAVEVQDSALILITYTVQTVTARLARTP